MQKIPLAIAASLGLALGGPVLAADTTRAQDAEQVRAQVHHTITTQGGVSQQDANDVDSDVGSHAAHAGYGPMIKKAIQDALAESPPCKGTCLADRIHAINHAMDQGKSPDQAARAASKAAHATGTPSDPDARSQDHRQDASHRNAASERSRDMAHDRDQDMAGHGGGHGMGAGHH